MLARVVFTFLMGPRMNTVGLI